MIATAALTPPSWYDHSAILDRDIVPSSKPLHAGFVEPSLSAVRQEYCGKLKGSRKAHGNPEAEHPWCGKIVHFVDTVVFHVEKSQQVGGFPRLHAQIRVVRMHPTA
jgi:hypothetical protein